MKAFKSLFILFLLSSCGAVINYDYEKSTDFSQYKTYNYFDDMQTGLSELDTKRLIRAIDAKLQSMGFERTNNADFYIDIQSQDIMNRTNSNVGVGVGGTGSNVGGGVSVGIPLGTNQNTRELVIEFVDDSKLGMFWQAIAESSYRPDATPEKRELDFKNLVERIFSAYPPKTQN
ncbi:DUF4136 domain-containing protein [Winogradskyella aurantia]|uniref:DUF4136 domain-containing protein n=1 Tax=Winogradskyella aurantia TaxID=1915063 RepID=A0A265UNF7_9FLAO|nr:DUF4136 domain-containing protein [Winogradskyella aurantia]OZV66886.1 hypothetical protein CA834_13690 [Winogradskyella aurantia]